MFTQPSKAWRGGSTWAWRKLRAAVLERDGWICGICHTPIPRGLRPPHPRSATVHHIIGKAAGDSLHHLVAAHRQCNQKAGDPRPRNPRPRPRTQW